MKTIVVQLVGHLGLTPVCKILMARYAGPTACYEACKFKEIMEASETDSTERLKRELDRFFGVSLVWLYKREEENI